MRAHRCIISHRCVLDRRCLVLSIISYSECCDFLIAFVLFDTTFFSIFSKLICLSHIRSLLWIYSIVGQLRWSDPSTILGWLIFLWRLCLCIDPWRLLSNDHLSLFSLVYAFTWHHERACCSTNAAYVRLWKGLTVFIKLSISVVSCHFR